MNFSAFTATLFLFVCVVLADVSPIAVHVDKIHQIVPKDKKRENTVKFLKDIKNWTNLLEKAAVKDFAGTKAVLVALTKPFSEMEQSDEETAKTRKLEGLSKVIANYERTLTEKDKDRFQIDTYVGYLADVLVAYDEAMKESDPRKQYKNAKPLGDLVEGFAHSLKKWNPDKWDKEFYDKLIKAANNENYEGGYLLYILLTVGIVLAVIGVAIFFILRRKKLVQS